MGEEKVSEMNKTEVLDKSDLQKGSGDDANASDSDDKLNGMENIVDDEGNVSSGDVRRGSTDKSDDDSLIIKRNSENGDIHYTFRCDNLGKFDYRDVPVIDADDENDNLENESVESDIENKENATKGSDKDGEDVDYNEGKKETIESDEKPDNQDVNLKEDATDSNDSEKDNYHNSDSNKKVMTDHSSDVDNKNDDHKNDTDNNKNTVKSGDDNEKKYSDIKDNGNTNRSADEKINDYKNFSDNKDDIDKSGDANEKPDSDIKDNANADSDKKAGPKTDDFGSDDDLKSGGDDKDRILKMIVDGGPAENQQQKDNASDSKEETSPKDVPAPRAHYRRRSAASVASSKSSSSVASRQSQSSKSSLKSSSQRSVRSATSSRVSSRASSAHIPHRSEQEEQKQTKEAQQSTQKEKEHPQSSQEQAKTSDKETTETTDVNKQEINENGENYVCSERLITLSRPKESKAIWITSFGPRVMWGTQDMLWPVPDTAKKAEATSRLQELARPKKNFQTGNMVNRDQYVYSCGRSSVICGVSPKALSGNCTERVGVLARHKTAPLEYKEDRKHYVYSCGRVSPIWPVKNQGRLTEASDRVMALSDPKRPHTDYLGERQIQTIIPPTALTSRASARLESLAEPKNRPDGPFREPTWPVSSKARNASPSNRCLELSKAKPVADGYVPNLVNPIWPVSKSARHANPTPRVNDLSLPIVRATMDHLQFDPDAFLVKDSAKKAVCSKRTEELAQPIER